MDGVDLVNIIWIRTTLPAFKQPEAFMKKNPQKLIREAISDNPELRVVLEIASRARAAEARELPREIGMATEVVTIPINSPYAV